MSTGILVPAGSYDSLVTSVNNGADAVYLGGSSFSARANAVNFTNEEIEKGVRYAHIRGAKVYVALNTLIEDDRLCEAFEFAKFCYLCGVDALIVQDLGVLSMLRKHFPDFKLNASTQMTIHNLKGVKAAEKAGFSRVVLSRELSKDEIGHICKNAKAEIEVFAHGALCMSYSGQCLMSSFIGGRSGNRGACAQPCRLPYTLLDENKNIICKDKYLLSLKDLCLIDEIETLNKLGVKSLKIEGRMKNSSYVAMTSYLYDKYRNGSSVLEEDIEDLRSVFSRNGFTKGYFENNTGNHMLNMHSNNDDVYKNISDSAKKRAEERIDFCGKKMPLYASFTANIGEKAVLCVWDDSGRSCTLESECITERAEKVPLTEKRIEEQIRKTGATPFEITELTVSIDDNISLPISQLNDLRRRAIEEMENQYSKNDREYSGEEFSFNIVKSDKRARFTASARTFEQVKALERTSAERIYVSKKVYDEYKDELSSDRFFVTLPSIERFQNVTQDYDRICISNFSQIYDDALIKHAGFRMNVFNSMAVKYLKETGFDSVCLSPELNLGGIREISKDIDTEVVAYGYLPVMALQNCVLKSANGKCRCNGDIHYLRDRKGVDFPLINSKGDCTNVILNSAPLYMGDKMADIYLSKVAYAMLNFTIESGDEVERVFEMYEKGLPFDNKFTRGHFYRGV